MGGEGRGGEGRAVLKLVLYLHQTVLSDAYDFPF